MCYLVVIVMEYFYFSIYTFVTLVSFSGMAALLLLAQFLARRFSLTSCRSAVI